MNDFATYFGSMKTESDRTAFVGDILRLVFHDAFEYDRNSDDKLGSDGCLSPTEMNLSLLTLKKSKTPPPIFIIESMWQVKNRRKQYK